MSPSAKEQIMDFVKAGPLYVKLVKPPAAKEWLNHGESMMRKLNLQQNPSEIAVISQQDSLVVRVYHLYLPVYFWIKETIIGMRSSNGKQPLMVGISAPQGCGKTTITNLLIEYLVADGLTCTAVSFDDFYLTGADQDSLASAHPENALLQCRGNAGTHDVALGESTINALRQGHAHSVAVPRYDKSAREGRGDRAPLEKFTSVSAPCDVILLEGWMAGFKPRCDADALAQIHPGLPMVDEMLNAYSAWDKLVDAWIVIALSDRRHIFEWRLQAEKEMAAAGRPGMSDQAIKDFVSRYMPAYEAYCPALYDAAAREGVDCKPTLRIDVDGARRPIPSPGATLNGCPSAGLEKLACPGMKLQSLQSSPQASQFNSEIKKHSTELLLSCGASSAEVAAEKGLKRKHNTACAK
jgi:D-glycerate 3-kinase